MKDSAYRKGANGWNPWAITQDIITAWRLLWDPRVSLKLKLLLPVAAAIYWISPLDLLPGLPFDDIVILLIALRAFVQLAPQDVVNNATASDQSDSEPYVDTTWRRVD